MIIVNHLSFTIEGPCLSFYFIFVSTPFIDLNVFVSMAFSNSVTLKSRSDVEWPSNMESKCIIKSFGFTTSCLYIHVDDRPLMSVSVNSVLDNNLDAFFIFSNSSNGSLTFLRIDNVFSFIFPLLPPAIFVRILATQSVLTSISCDTDRSTGHLFILNSLCLTIKDPDTCFSGNLSLYNYFLVTYINVHQTS